MKKIKPKILAMTVLVVFLFSTAAIYTANSAEAQPSLSPQKVVPLPKPTPLVAEALAMMSEDMFPTATPELEPLISNEGIELIALVTMAEAEGECEEGKRLVIDTILNRMDSPNFPDTAYDVIWQKNQFSSMWNGRTDRCYVREDICQLVREELENRSNYDVIFFNAGHYSEYGTPLFQVEHHYFSSY